MNRICFFLLLLAFQPCLYAQQYTIRGHVVNNKNEAMAYTAIRLITADNAPLLQTMTDSTGAYLMEAEAGTYQLLVEQFDQSLSLHLSSDTLLPAIAVDDAVALEGFVFTERKRLLEQKVDRLVFHVENATSVTGGNALDALKATPTVRVQNETISIPGKGEVLIMIDDRLQRLPAEDLAALLKSIPANTIKSIEVITTPPAKYDAAGSSGLINIKLKTARKNAWNANLGASYLRKTYNSGNLQGLFQYNHNKLSVQASASTGKEKLLTSSESHIFYPGETWQQSVRNNTRNDMLGLGLGIDYKLSRQWTTGLKYSGSFTQRKSINHPFTTRTDDKGNVNGYIATDVNADNMPGMNALNWYHAIKLDSSGKQLTIDIDYFNYQKKDNQFFAGNEWDYNKNIVPNTFFSAKNANVNQIKNYALKTDLSLPYKWADISLGAKLSSTNTLNDLKVYDHRTGAPVLNTEQSNVFSYKEYNEALYLSAQKQFNEQWASQIGLRMEATQTEGFSKNLQQRHKNSYWQCFPTAYLTYIPDEKNSFSINYSRRIRRPDFDYLNPFIVRTSPYFYSEGNPLLQPSFIDNISFSYTKNQQWVNSVYYTRVSDFSQELSIIDPETNITRQTPLNYGNMHQLGLSSYYNFNKWSWWNSFTGFNVNYQQVSSLTEYIRSTAGYNAYLYTNNDFTLNKSKSVFLGVNYSVQPAGTYQIFHISTMHMLDISMKVLALKQKLSLTLTAEDLLNGQRPLITYRSNGIQNDVRSYGDSRGFRISLSYNFGNNNIKSVQRDQGNTEERSRTK